jgi:hypothetical protein
MDYKYLWVSFTSIRAQLVILQRLFLISRHSESHRKSGIVGEETSENLCQRVKRKSELMLNGIITVTASEAAAAHSPFRRVTEFLGHLPRHLPTYLELAFRARLIYDKQVSVNLLTQKSIPQALERIQKSKRFSSLSRHEKFMEP